MSPAAVLAASAFTGVASLSAGLLAMHMLKLRTHRNEVLPFAYVLGSAVLSSIVFVLCALRIAYAPVFAVIGVALMSAAVWQRAWRVLDSHTPPSVSRKWRWILIAAFAVYGLFTFAHALAPESSPDGTAYHLGVVGRYFRNGGFDWYTTNFYASLPMGVEMLFLFAYSFGRHSAAALMHWQFLIVLPWLVLNCGRRFHVPTAGAIAALLVFMSPVVGIDGSSAYVDIAMAAAAFAMFYALLIWEREGSGDLNGWLIAAGVLAGWVYACKMTGFPAIVLATGYVAVTLLRARRLSIRPVLTVGICAALIAGPWLVKNALTVGNPFSPFLNRVFPNPYVTIHFEDEYRKGHRDYYGTIKSAAEIPAEVTVRGGKLNGLLGPVFLLAPLGLIALRWPLGRRAWTAAALFLISYPTNIGTRFLIISLPFVSLAMGLVLANWRAAGMAAILFHAFFSWPPVVKAYANEYAWRLDTFRWRAALRLDGEEGFLHRYVPYYALSKLVELHVPPDGQVLTFGNVAEAYTSRDIRVIYESAMNGIAGETLASAVSPNYHPTVVWEYRFPKRQARRMRLVQTATAPEPFNVNELRAYTSAGGEIPRDYRWRVRAHPFPWTVQFAFDSSPITRWRTWEPAVPGQWIEMDFGRPCDVAAIRAEISPDQRTRARVEAETAPGTWEVVSVEPQVSAQAPVANSRLIAADELKRLGITHLAISHTDFMANDLFRNRKAWGVTLLGETPYARLYRID